MISELFPDVLANSLLLLGLILLFLSTSQSNTNVRFLLAIIFFYINIKYLWWRYEATLPVFSFDPAIIWMWSFYTVECFAALVLSWHFFVLIHPTNRRKEADHWESMLQQKKEFQGVDIFIPTYNESPEVLDRTIQAACNVDYPNIQVWVLDDGKRDWLQQYCETAPVRYITRADRVGHKAGNLNNGLRLSNNPLICVLDADFVLHKNFLQRTIGFLDEPSVGLIQTPQYFTNPDAIQYNLGGEKAWPEAQCMFSDVLQSCRDGWDNAFCYGTSFVVKRECLVNTNGFPEDTVAEDLHTSYVLLAQGYKTRFLNERLSSGIATQNIGEFVAQRTRWCVGSLQCLFVDGGVLRSRRISIMDRLFYLDPILYHMGTLWTFCLLIAPSVYWWLGVPPFYSDFGHLLVVLAPRMIIVMLGFYWLSNRKTIPVVSELGRVVGIFFLVSAIFKVIFNPFKQEFHITIKHVKTAGHKIYWQIFTPLACLLLLTVSGMMTRYSGALGVDILWRTDAGLMISLTIYVMWLLYLACLTCVQRSIPNGPLNTVDVVHTGSIRRTAKVLFKRIFLWR